MDSAAFRKYKLEAQASGLRRNSFTRLRFELVWSPKWRCPNKLPISWSRAKGTVPFSLREIWDSPRGNWDSPGLCKAQQKSRRSFDRRLCGSDRPDQPATRSTNPASCWLRTGCCSLRTALASICLTLSRVTLKIRPTSSRVYVYPSPRP